MITQNGAASPSPGTRTFMPKIEAINVSGRNTTVSTVSTRSTSFSWWERTDSFVASSASTVSL